MKVPYLPKVAPKLLINPENSRRVFPRATVARASEGTYFNQNGVLVTAPANTPRVSHRNDNLQSPGILMETSRTNLVKNSTATGSTIGVTGEGGALPTLWSQTPYNITNVKTEVKGTGVEDGIPYIDIRFFGTSIINYHAIVFHGGATGSGDIVADSYYGNSVFARVVAGAIPTTVSFKSRFDNGSYQSIDTNKTLSNANLTGASLGRLRHFVMSKSPTTVSGSWQSLFVFNFATGTTMDFTVRFGAPQMELGSGSSSPILTSGSQVTRAADQIELPMSPTTDFTLFVDYSLESILSLSRVAGMFLTSDQTKYISVVAAKEDMSAAGGVYSPPNINTINPTTTARYLRTKVAYTYRQSDGQIRISVNGTILAGGLANAGMVFDLLALSGMLTASPTHKLGGLLHRIAYYDTLLTDNELIGITS